MRLPESSTSRERDLIEKDLILHQILFDLSGDRFFAANVLFKGGTCLIKSHFGYLRFSEDIDFTWKDQSVFEGMSQKSIRAYLSSVIDKIGEIFEKIAKRRGLNFKCEKSNAEYIEFGGGNKTCIFKIWYISEILNRRSFLKVQINFVESMCFPPRDGELSGLLTGEHEELEALFPEYAEYTNKITFSVYDIREILSEKVRALLTREGTKARDFLDVYFICKHLGIKLEDVEGCIEQVAPQLSRIRTLLFGMFAIVWFSEMVLWGFQPLSEVWTNVWKMIPPENPQLATALYITHAVEAPLKGALGVLAVFGLRSKNPSARSALFLSMALVPPLNIAFQFREQGFPLRSTAVAMVLSIILWGLFFLFKDPAQRPEQRATINSGQLPPSRWEIFQYVWLAANAAALTLVALLFLFWPRTALNLTLPCLSSLLDTHKGELASLIDSNLGIGTHLLVLAIASWIATVYCRSNPALRQAVTIASTVNAGLLILLALRQIILEFGGTCATSSILIAFVPLFVGWVLYAAFLYRVKPKIAG